MGLDRCLFAAAHTKRIDSVDGCHMVGDECCWALAAVGMT